MMYKRPAGYLIIDHSASPGISEEFARKSGTPFVPEGKVFEADTFVCPHCGGVVLKNPMRERPRNTCRKCYRLVCDKPECNAGCLPLAQQFDVMEAQGYRDIGTGINRVEQALTLLRRSILG